MAEFAGAWNQVKNPSARAGAHIEAAHGAGAADAADDERISVEDTGGVEADIGRGVRIESGAEEERSVVAKRGDRLAGLRIEGEEEFADGGEEARFAAGIVCYFAVVKVKNMFGYDDSLDAFGVHGVGGTLGAILTGVFATKEVNALKDAAGNAINTGLVDGNGGQVVNQIIGVAISWGIAIVGSFIILKIVDVVVGLRVTSEQETMGHDLSMHGEEGYNLEA